MRAYHGNSQYYFFLASTFIVLVIKDAWNISEKRQISRFYSRTDTRVRRIFRETELFRWTLSGYVNKAYSHSRIQACKILLIAG
jgi:hypothetical protein